MLRFERDGLWAGVGAKERVRLDASGPMALAARLGDAVSFAPGLTGGCLMRALAPWSAFLSVVCGADIGDWARVAGGGQARAVEDVRVPATPGPPLSSTELYPHVSLSPDGSASTLHVEWRVRCRSGNPAGPAYALPADPFEWAHLPFVVTERAEVEGPGAEGLGPVVVEPNLCDAIVFGFLEELSMDATVAGAISREAALMALVPDGMA